MLEKIFAIIAVSACVLGTQCIFVIFIEWYYRKKRGKYPNAPPGESSKEVTALEDRQLDTEESAGTTANTG